MNRSDCHCHWDWHFVARSSIAITQDDKCITLLNRTDGLLLQTIQSSLKRTRTLAGIECRHQCIGEQMSIIFESVCAN